MGDAQRDPGPNRPVRVGRRHAGQLDWRFPIAGRVPQIAVALDGNIYLGTVFNENDWNNESYAYALTATGALKWRQKVRSYDWGAGQGTSGGPAVDDEGNVLIPSTYTQLLKLSSEGDTIWTYQGQHQSQQPGLARRPPRHDDPAHHRSVRACSRWIPPATRSSPARRRTRGPRSASRGTATWR